MHPGNPPNNRNPSTGTRARIPAPIIISEMQQVSGYYTGMHVAGRKGHESGTKRQVQRLMEIRMHIYNL